MLVNNYFEFKKLSTIEQRKEMNKYAVRIAEFVVEAGFSKENPNDAKITTKLIDNSKEDDLLSLVSDFGLGEDYESVNGKMKTYFISFSNKEIELPYNKGFFDTFHSLLYQKKVDKYLDLMSLDRLADLILEFKPDNFEDQPTEEQ